MIGNRANAKCEIVTRNPVINPQIGGNIWFGSGPYKSLGDAKPARSTIRSCPAVEEPPAETPDNEDKSNQSILEPFRVRKTRRPKRL